MNIRKLSLTLPMMLLLYFGFVPSWSPVSVTTSAFAASSKLGDLSKFRKIVADTEGLVAKNNLIGAKARIKDLETSWDDAEPSLKPRAANEWHMIDKGIDRALSSLRNDPPDSVSCKKSISNLLSLFDQAAGK